MKPDHLANVRIRHPEHFEIGEYSIVDDFSLFLDAGADWPLLAHRIRLLDRRRRAIVSSRSATSAACRPA